MKTVFRSAEGFSLIELMIVVAIIGILAAIAIPQFAQYRMRAFNASAESDLRNLKTAEEVLNGDCKHYGGTGRLVEKKNLADAAQTTGSAVGWSGPLSAATTAEAGAYIAGQDTLGKPHAIGIGVGNSVHLAAVTDSNYANYNTYAHHFQGHRVFASEGDNTAIFYCQNDTKSGFVGKQGALGGATAGAAPSSQNEFISGSTACGGAPIAQWTAL